MKNNYDRVNLTLPKGKKAIIQAEAEKQETSLNSYVNEAIDEKMERDTKKADG